MVAASDRPPQDSPLTGSVMPVMTYAGPMGYAETDAANGNSATGGGPGPSELLHSLRRQWLPGCVIGVCLAAVAAGAAWYGQKPEFTSTAFLKISARDAPLIFETADRAARPDFKTYLQTQKQLMLTPLVLNAALRTDAMSSLPRIKTHTNPIEWLQKELVVAFESEIGQISFSDGDPAVAKGVVDGVVAAYMEEVVLAEENFRSQRLDNLENVHAQAETTVRAKRDELRNLVETHGTGDPESLSLAQQSALQEFGLFRNELTRVQFELMRAEGELELRKSAAENADGSNPTETGELPADAAALALDQMTASDPTASGLVREIGRLQGSIAEARRRFTPAAAAGRVQNYETQMEELRRQLASRREVLQRTLAMQGAALANSGTVLATTPTSELEFEIAVLKKQEQELNNQVKDRQEVAKMVGLSSIDVEMLRKEIASLDDVLSGIGSEIERTRIELRGGARTSVISPASAPLSEGGKKRAAIAAVGGMAGFGLPIALLVLLDVRRRRVDGVATITDHLHLDVLGVVPRIPPRVMRRLSNEPADADPWQERLAESINSVTAMVLRKAAQEDKRVILVSSAVAGEGKTTLAGQLGVRLAETGHRTLVIDFDLRRPALHVAFDAALEPGVTDVLDGTTDLVDAVQPTDHPNLSLLAAGSRASNLLNAAAQGLLEDFFESVRPEFEFIVVDCCPVLPVVDTRLIAPFGDGIILSVLRDVSEAPKVGTARAILQSHGVPVMGTVVTGCSQEVYRESRLPALAAM